MTRVLLCVLVCACLGAPALADTYAERLARWQAQWRAEHPGQPLPNDGVLQKLHRNELIQQMNSDWDAGRKLRQEELRREYMLSRYNQQQINAKSGIKWTDAQWRAWDQRYIAEHKLQAEEFARNWELMGEMARQRAMQEEHDRYVREHP